MAEEQTEMDAIRAAFSANPNGQKTVATPVVETPVVVNTPVVETPIIETPVTETPVAETPVIETPIVETPIVETPIVEIPVLTFEQQLEAKTGGKYKSVEDIEKITNTPKEELDPEIKRYQELKKAGVTLDREFFELQALDLTKLDPMSALVEAAKRKPEWKGLSEDMIEAAIAKKYNMNEWIDKEEADYTDDDKLNYALWLRDANQDGEFLTNYKKERMLVKETDTAETKRMADQKKANQDSWTSYVDNDLVSKTTEISIPVEYDKDGKVTKTFDYKLSEADRKDIGNTLKLSGEDVDVFFNRFALLDDKGQPQKNPNGSIKVDHQRIYKMLLLEKSYNQMAKNLWNDAKAAGAKSEVDKLKNTNFTPNPGQTVPDTGAPKTQQEAIREAFKKKGVKV